MKYTSDGLTPGRYLVDTFPWLKYVPAWVPGASFQVVGREGKKFIKAAFSDPFDDVMAAMVSGRSQNAQITLIFECKASGTANPSFTVRCLEKMDQDGDVAYQQLVIRNVAGIMFGGVLTLNTHPTEMD